MAKLSKTMATKLKFKECQIVGGKFFDDGVEVDLNKIFTDVFGDKYFALDAQIQSKDEEDI